MLYFHKMDFIQLQQRNRELAILNTIAAQLNRETTLEKALDATLKQTVELLELGSGWIWLFPPEEGLPFLAAAFNLPPVFLQNPELLSGAQYCYCLETYQKEGLEEAMNIHEITCTRLKDLTKGTSGLRYHASIPLKTKQNNLGILNVASPKMQELSTEKLQLLYTIGDMLSIAIQRARLFENSRQLGISEERNRLAREIHDTLAQGLSAISLKLETLDAFLENDYNQQKARENVQQILQLTKDQLSEARRSVLDLRATPLQESNLPQALEKLLKEKCHNKHLTVSFDFIGIYKKQPLRTELGLYRVAQEALQNSAKHANADTISLVITYHKDSIKLEIQDNGKGFTPNQASSSGFGLIGINERIKLLGGKIDIQSAPSLGTKITVEIPIE